MVRPYIFCPTCQTVRSMSISLSLHTETGAGGEAVKHVMLNYHCDSCFTFVLQTPVLGSDAENERVVYHELVPSGPG